ncbi:MAG: nuclear transport factor 2 family protein [Phycisphaerales bacterium]|nr:MAG: nuclear transport factor 2 family protein [Phycisphaerales bacterium]
MRLTPQLLHLILIICLLTGCGGKEPPTVPNREAFDAAVESYLDRQAMELAIRQYREFEMAEDGATATAVISMGHADEAYGNVQVHFRFNFEKTGDRWRVVSHQKVKR